MFNITTSVDNLIRRMKYLIYTGTITSADYFSIKKQYDIIQKHIKAVYRERSLDAQHLNYQYKEFQRQYCCFNANPVFSLTNEEGDIDLNFPLGVISVNGDYIGIANDTAEYISLWNSNSANLSVGTLISGDGTEFEVQLVDPNSTIALTALEFYTITSNNSNSVMHIDDNDIVVYGAGTAVRGSTGTLTASSAVNMYNGANGVQVETPFNVRRVTTVNTIGNPIHILHSRISTRIGMDLLKDCQTLSGVLPKACITLALRITDSTDLVSNVSNWNELQSIESWSIMGLGGGVYNITTPAFIPQPPPSVKALSLRDIGPEPITLLTSFTWLTFSALPNLRRLVVGMNQGDMIGTGVAFFSTMPRVDKELSLTNNNAVQHTSDADSDTAINNIAAALALVIPVAPKVIRLENTEARTAASTAASTQLTTATWSVTYT